MCTMKYEHTHSSSISLGWLQHILFPTSFFFLLLIFSSPLSPSAFYHTPVLIKITQSPANAVSLCVDVGEATNGHSPHPQKSCSSSPGSHQVPIVPQQGWGLMSTYHLLCNVSNLGVFPCLEASWLANLMASSKPLHNNTWVNTWEESQKGNLEGRGKCNSFYDILPQGNTGSHPSPVISSSGICFPFKRFRRHSGGGPF